MSTQLHRLQISLPHWQAQFLAERARRDKVSLAEVIRRMIQHEAEAGPTAGDADSLMALAGLAEDRGPLVGEAPVSERPDLYLAELAAPRPRRRAKGGRRARAKAAR